MQGQLIKQIVKLLRCRAGAMAAALALGFTAEQLVKLASDQLAVRVEFAKKLAAIAKAQSRRNPAQVVITGWQHMGLLVIQVLNAVLHAAQKNIGSCHRIGGVPRHQSGTGDALQGVKLADLLIAKGVTDIAITYVNNDYGKGFADALAAAYTAGGGTIAANVAHEEGKADYRAELGNLTASQNLVILAYANASGNTILRQAVESGNFTTYVGGDGMVGDDLLSGIDAAAVEGLIATRAGAPAGDATTTYTDLATTAGIEASATYAPQAYDAAFLLALAIEKSGSTDRAGIAAALRDVSSAPGEKILPGEWTKAVELIKAGTDIDYEGAGGALDFDAAGDVDGIIVELAVEGGAFVEKGEIK
ncbi:MAG: hypothetical protein B7Z15_17785 [Rhizobiales bacterium 32-66-8]|nr:MAG: hypothetical protein B7Z15_17785 [Rhizobiales bacterium 32-66-8]